MFENIRYVVTNFASDVNSFSSFHIQDLIFLVEEC